jgi:hypothetical protein
MCRADAVAIIGSFGSTVLLGIVEHAANTVAQRCQSSRSPAPLRSTNRRIESCELPGAAGFKPPAGIQDGGCHLLVATVIVAQSGFLG